MALEIPLTFDSEKINNLFRKLWPLIKVFGYLIWVALIIHFYYRYLQSGNLYMLAIAIVLLGAIGEKIWAKWKANRKKR